MPEGYKVQIPIP